MLLLYTFEKFPSDLNFLKREGFESRLNAVLALMSAIVFKGCARLKQVRVGSS